LLYSDETNREPSETARFFIYGGLIIAIDQLGPINDGLLKIRLNAGYRPSEDFKFNISSRPSHVDQSAFLTAKRTVLELCERHNVRFIAYMVHHSVASDRDLRIRAALNTVLGKFNYFLRKQRELGICVIDRLPENERQFEFIQEKFRRGLTFNHDDRQDRPLDGIKLFTVSCIGASHIASAVDIVLGSFRYCMNFPDNERASPIMMKQVVNLLWCTKNGERIDALEKGLILRPRDYRKDSSGIPYANKYAQDYDNVITTINSLLSQ
jgi:hypothetical protein